MAHVNMDHINTILFVTIHFSLNIETNLLIHACYAFSKQIRHNENHAFNFNLKPKMPVNVIGDATF